MTASVDQALRRIDKVLSSAFAPEVAYPLRARLGRATLSASKVEATLIGSEQLSFLVNRLQVAAKHVMQPSEPFDAHWREQWGDVLEDLRSLRALLEPYSAAQRGPEAAVIARASVPTHRVAKRSNVTADPPGTAGKRKDGNDRHRRRSG